MTCLIQGFCKRLQTPGSHWPKSVLESFQTTGPQDHTSVERDEQDLPHQHHPAGFLEMSMCVWCWRLSSPSLSTGFVSATQQEFREADIITMLMAGETGNSTFILLAVNWVLLTARKLIGCLRVAELWYRCTHQIKLLLTSPVYPHSVL